MTYHDQQPGYRLVWSDGHELAGLEVRCAATTMAARMAVEVFDRRVRKGRPMDLAAVDLAAVFVRHVSGWDVRAEGRLVPVELDAFMMLDWDVVCVPVLRKWRELVLNPPREQPTVEPEPVEDEVPAVELDLVATTLTDPRDGEEQVDGERPQDPVPFDDAGYGDSWRVPEPV